MKFPENPKELNVPKVAFSSGFALENAIDFPNITDIMKLVNRLINNN